MMERKKKDQKTAAAAAAATAIALEPETNEPQSKEEQNQLNAAGTAKSTGAGAGSPSQDNTTSLNQQFPSVVQWPYTPHNASEQPSSSSRPCLPTQSPPPIAVSQWHQLPHPQLNSNANGHQVQQAQSFPQFWLPQRPGYHLPGVNGPALVQSFPPFGAIDTSWPCTAVIGGGNTSKDHLQVPHFYYQAGYPYPGFPAHEVGASLVAGPWNPSGWWGQVQQSQLPWTYTLPGSYGNFSSQPLAMTANSASLGEPSQRGIIKSPAKLSQKHQYLWEAQSAENVRLWTVIDQLQSDIAENKSRIAKLETEVSSLKQVTEEPSNRVSGTALVGKASKRGRPKRSVASLDALPSTDETQTRTRGRKSAHCKVQSQARAINHEKVLTKVENKEKPGNLQSTAPQEDENITNIVGQSSCEMGANGNNVMLPSFQIQVHRELPGIRNCNVDRNSSIETNHNDDKAKDPINGFAILSQQAEGIKNRNALRTDLGARNNGSTGWPSTFASEGSGGLVLNMESQSFGNNSIGPRPTGWSFMNEGCASEEFEDAAVASRKGENEAVMRDDASSGSDVPPTTEAEGLPQYNHW